MTKTIQCHIRMTEQTKRELDALVENSVSPTISEYIRQLVHEKYQELEKGEKIMSRNWLGYRTSKKSDKQKAIDEFEEIGIGGLEIDEYGKMSVEEIENMTSELKEALQEYESSLDSPDDADANRVMEIVKFVTLPYLEALED
jgi:Arc/MetJ-type ribon-helix-helix transcriptional regulator